MQVRELVDLGRFLRRFIEREKLSERYQELITAVNQAAQDTNPEAVGAHFDELQDLHERAEAKILSPAQRHLLIEYGADRLLGEDAAIRLRGIFRDHQAHPQGLVKELQNLKSETDQLVERAEHMISFLDPMLEKLDAGEIGVDEGRLWLYFAEAASVENIEDLEEASQTWKQVLHHFSRMPGTEVEKGRILQIHKYSPLEIEVASNIAVLVPLAVGIQWVLSRIEHVIRILQEAERLKQLKVKTEIIDALREEAEEKRQEIASQAADDLQERFEADNEARNAVEQALRSVIGFIEGGGELDIDVQEPATANDDEEHEEGGEPAPNRAELRRLISEIRKNIRLLPPGTDEEPVENDNA